MLGYTEKEVGHWTFNKWNKLYEYYKSFYNFKTQNNLFAISNNDKADKSQTSYEWFDD